MPDHSPSLFFRPIAWLGWAVLFTAVTLPGRERNGWPFLVEQVNEAGVVESGEYLGPLVFTKTESDGTHVGGFRPIFVHTEAGPKTSLDVLYPLFTSEKEDDFRGWSVFQLINFSHQENKKPPDTRDFAVWPFYFSHQTADSADSYRALFPLGGTLKHFLGKDRIHFVLFPLYAEVDEGGMRKTHAPWPFLRFVAGDGNHGFEFWPLFGHTARAGDYDSQFYLWPFFYKSARNLSDPEPSVSVGALPFYARDTAPGLVNVSYGWPFCGYTHRTEPYRYDERRFFWPFLVQGHGDQHYVNRWGPLYTHSIIKGYDKTWIAWPLFRHARWEDAGIAHQRDQFLFFLYWSEYQRSLTNPAAAPAHLTHVWPLLSSWDNGAGQRQWQFLSPFEPLFPGNVHVRRLYTPLFALYRFDQRGPDDTRHSVLFNLVSWRKSPEETEFHFGPFLRLVSTKTSSRVALGLGLLDWKRSPGSADWRFSLFDFRPERANKAIAAKSP